MSSSHPFVFAVVSLGLAFAAPANAAPRSRPPVHVNVGVDVSLPHGYIHVQVGGDRYEYHEGVFYRREPRGYVVVRPPRGARVPVLPRTAVRVVIGGVVYHRHGNVYYRAVDRGFVVVDAPIVIEREPAAEAAPHDFHSVWLGETEYLLEDGAFFRRMPAGLVWQEPPYGAITRALPRGATSIWHEDVEYFDAGGVYFRKVPDGYKLVPKPWAANTPPPPVDAAFKGASL